MGYGKRIGTLDFGGSDPQKYPADQILGLTWAAEVALDFNIKSRYSTNNEETVSAPVWNGGGTRGRKRTGGCSEDNELQSPRIVRTDNDT
jgi:hypothetical protein